MAILGILTRLRDLKNQTFRFAYLLIFFGRFFNFELDAIGDGKTFLAQIC